MSKKSPQLRFEGFTDDWEDRELGEEFKKVSERNDGSFGRDHWISVAKMYFQSPEKVQSNNIDTRTYVMREGDIAFEGHPNSEFKFGRFVANDIGAGVVSELFPIYKHQHEYDNNYWKNAIQIERIMAPIFAKSITSSGNSSNKLDTKHFLRQKILIPQINEQKKMGSFFKQLDNTIALHQRKLDLLKEQKKGYLQKMFPKNGAKVPELRFAGFADDWELRRFSELAEIRRGLTYSPVNIRLEGIRVLRSSNIDEDTFTFGEDDVFVDKGVVKSPLVKEGDILITAANGSSRLVGKHTIIKDLPENSAIHGGFMLLASCRNPEFINSLMSSAWYTKFINLYVAGGNGAIGNLNKHDLDEQNVLVPSQKEQSAIGTFFSTLDQHITLHQRKS